MKFLSYRLNSRPAIAVDDGDGFRGLAEGDDGYPGNLASLVEGGEKALRDAADVLRSRGAPVDPEAVEVLPPLIPGKILCVGLNYADHAAESNMAIPEYPTIFSRFASSIVAPGAPIRLPRVSKDLDYETELAVIIGKRGRYIDKADALSHVAGYAAFNDVSVRDYQLRTPQWTLGKTFDGSGPFGPVMVTADALPPGASGLAIEGRLNGQTVQKSNTRHLIFDVATLIATLSEALTLEPGDVIITGTPAGVGGARKPQLFMKDGDVFEIEIEGIGLLRNPVKADD
nr:fumarylacetoacetate hydrolase family protein [Sphingomonas sp. Y57]